MDPFTAGALISGGSTLLGGYLGGQAQDKANAANREMNAENIKMQKEFAQSGVQWKVEDAKKAGIHPLAALGAQTHSFAPASIGESPNTAMGDSIANMGQNIAQAYSASTSKNDRLINEAMRMEQLDNARLQNELLRSQIIDVNSKPRGPGLPNAVDASAIPGQGNAYVTKPAELTASHRGRPAQEAGAINSYAFQRTHSGGLAVVPSKDSKERTEDDLIQQLSWFGRNQLIPAIKGLPAPSAKDYPLPPTARSRGATHWKWSPIAQEFQPHNGKHFINND